MSLPMLGTQSCAASARPLISTCHIMQIPSVRTFASTEGFRVLQGVLSSRKLYSSSSLAWKRTVYENRLFHFKLSWDKRWSHHQVPSVSCLKLPHTGELAPPSLQHGVHPTQPRACTHLHQLSWISNFCMPTHPWPHSLGTGPLSDEMLCSVLSICSQIPRDFTELCLY